VLRQANEILRQPALSLPKGRRHICAGGARPPVSAIIAFIDDRRDAYRVLSVCRVLSIAPCTYYEHVT
jgi:putative transposase